MASVWRTCHPRPGHSHSAYGAPRPLRVYPPYDRVPVISPLLYSEGQKGRRFAHISREWQSRSSDPSWVGSAPEPCVWLLSPTSSQLPLRKQRQSYTPLSSAEEWSEVVLAAETTGRSCWVGVTVTFQRSVRTADRAIGGLNASGINVSFSSSVLPQVCLPW